MLRNVHGVYIYHESQDLNTESSHSDKLDKLRCPEVKSLTHDSQISVYH